LGEHHRCADGLRVRQGGSELGTVRTLPALRLDVLFGERPATAVQVAIYGFSLGFNTEAATALLVRADAQVRDEFARGHVTPPLLRQASRTQPSARLLPARTQTQPPARPRRRE